MPYYAIQDFIGACQNNKVFIRQAAKDGAREFNLLTNQDILDFIANHGLEGLSFFNSKPLEQNPFPDHQVFVDAYHFSSGFDYGYIAFFKNPKLDNWVLKSFKKDPDSDPRNMPLRENKILKDLQERLENQQYKGKTNE